MLFSFDRTNFPLIAIERVGIEVHLLPITKWQFEQFLADSGVVYRSRYEEMLALNAAVEPALFSVDEPEPLFVSGVLPDEALAFARWLGEGYDLPTRKEWRTIYNILRTTGLPRHGLTSDLVEGVAGELLDKFAAHPHVHTMLDVALMGRGLVEWVRHETKLIGLGAPRPEFHPNLWDPSSNEVHPINPDERVFYFGFRLVRRGKWYLADKSKVRYVY